MILSKSCVYGIRSVLMLAVENEKKFISIKEIAHKLNIPFHFLTKILQILGHANILESVRGPKGGIALKVPSEELSVKDIISAFDGNKLFEDCVMGINGCTADDPCALHKAWDSTKSRLEIDFQSVSLKDLAKKIKKGKVRLYDIKKESKIVNN